MALHVHGRGGVAMASVSLEDARSSDPVGRLLEDSWRERSQQGHRRELIVETLVGLAFLVCAAPMAIAALSTQHFDAGLAVLLVALYALTSRMIKFPIGAGYVVPSYLVLVPMLLLLPAGTVPLLTAAGLVLGTLALVLMRRAPAERVLFAVPDAWHAVGPALVLMLAGRGGSDVRLALVYTGAFAAGCALDLLSGTVREWAIAGVASRVQLRVQAVVWMVDACIAPLGLLVAHAMRRHTAEALLIVPLNFVLLMVERDRTARIEQAQQRLELVAHERTRLQGAVRRLGDALAAKLDVQALAEIVLRGSIDALDASIGRVTFAGADLVPDVWIGSEPGSEHAIAAAAAQAEELATACQLERRGVWALALPFFYAREQGEEIDVRGSVTVARPGREFRADERALMEGLVDRARQAASDIVAHQRLREQAFTDPLTRLGNRRRLIADMDVRMESASSAEPLVLILFDLNGFKSYNDTFGHQAGDAVLQRVGGRLATAMERYDGAAYRLGGDEFCAVLSIPESELEEALAKAAAALEEHGENFAVTPALGAVLMPQEATTLDQALQLADERMYSNKRQRTSLAGEQARDVLMRIIHAKQPALQQRGSDVAQLCARVGSRLRMSRADVDELVRAAELHDIGKVGIPDAILRKADELTEAEWAFVKQHTVLGARILGAVPALRTTAEIVRATHERWDGEGYPDGLRGAQIPLASRVISACDAYETMTSGRSHRGRRSPGEACAELMREAGAQFDPGVVGALMRELADASEDAAAPERAAGPAQPRAAGVSARLRDAVAGGEISRGSRP
jgi:diguanylate cyclase (GGDEF)-like protein